MPEDADAGTDVGAAAVRHPTGRPRGSARDAILLAAEQLFSQRGFSRTTVRDIAALARADAALVKYHFGSKEALFLEITQSQDEWFDIVHGPLDGLGAALVEALLAAEHEGRGRAVFAALIRASDSPQVRQRLERSMNEQFVRPIAERLTGDDADLRARLFAAQVQGLMTVLWIIGDEQLLSADRASIVARYGAALHATLQPSTAGRAG